MIKLKCKKISEHQISFDMSVKNEVLEEWFASIYGLIESANRHFDIDTNDLLNIINKHYGKLVIK